MSRDFSDEEPTQPEVALSMRELAELSWARLTQHDETQGLEWDEATHVPTGEEVGE